MLRSLVGSEMCIRDRLGVFGGTAPARAALMELTLTNPDPTNFQNRTVLSIPLVINYDSEGDPSYQFYAPWPVDSTFLIDEIAIRHFLYTDAEPYTTDNYDGASRIVQFGPGRSDTAGVLRVVMTQAQLTAIEAAIASSPNPVIAHFTGFGEAIRAIEVERISSTVVDPTPNGWVFADLESPAIAGITASWLVDPQTTVLITEGATEITTVVANPTPVVTTSNELSQLSVNGTTYNIPTFTLPLYARKSDLFLGIEGPSVTRDFITTGSQRLERVPVTPYTTVEGLNPDGTENMVTYYFIPDIGRPPLPTTNLSEWVTGDGVWTSLDFTDNTVSIIDVTADNMVNLIG